MTVSRMSILGGRMWLHGVDVAIARGSAEAGDMAAGVSHRPGA